MASIKIKYHKPTKDGCIRVSLRLMSSNTEKHVRTGIMLRKGDYRVKKNGDISITDRISADKLDEIVYMWEKKLRELNVAYSNRTLSADEVYGIVIQDNGIPANQMKDFFAYTRAFLEQDDELSEGTKRTYRCMMNSLARYCKSDKLPFSSITSDFLSSYIKSFGGRKKAAFLYYTKMKRIVGLAATEYNTDKVTFVYMNPFKRVRVKESRSIGQRALSLETLRSIFSMQTDNRRMRMAIDICMISFCLMGTNAVDLYNMSVYKNGTICYDRSKTHKKRMDRAHIEIKVPKYILPLMDKYKSSQKGHVFNFHETFAKVSCMNSFLSRSLNLVEESLGLDEHVTFYSFRHTFATIARNDLRTDPITVEQALNHVCMSNPLLDVYVKKDYSIINDLNQKVSAFVFDGMA